MSFLIFFIGFGLIILDRITKWLILANPNLFQSHFVQLELFKNPKLYFWSINSTVLYIVISAVLGLVVFLLIKTWHKNNTLLSFGLLLIILGGVSNLIDRIFCGYVIDWIRVFFLPISIFNIADIMIVGGLVCLLIKVIFNNKL